MSVNSPEPNQTELNEIPYDTFERFANDDMVPLGDNFKNVLEVLDAEELKESPIDINISHVIPVPTAPPLAWINYDLPPKKMKITNTGHTVILSGKWGQERPYLCNGVLNGKYVFSQMHLHWGVNDMEGSEHTVDDSYYPGELHVVLFKSCYLTQESALKEKDGVAILVYFLKLQDPMNTEFQLIVDALPAVAKAHTSAKISPVPLSYMMKQFEADYFTYKGTVNTTNCIHPILWLITRIPMGVSSDQIDSFRYLLDNDDEIIKRNFRPIQPIDDRHVFHILPSTSKYSTLLPAPLSSFEDKTVMQIYCLRLLYNKRLHYLRQTTRNYDNQMKSLVGLAKNRRNDDVIEKALFVISKLFTYMDYIYDMLIISLQ
ncbi:carbonic anhydrase 2-like [Anthonomus grandis grandis]|uniref:carbonic anhydrase 2-like n=1 Tax=Anthonomus grandis grandis TaxID=2921223 RepID=UPI002164FD3D|nr:carbonic anhydrase 2-like [Anthonomus grandis grandis]